MHLEAVVAPLGHDEAVALHHLWAGVAGRRGRPQRQRHAMLVVAIDQHGDLAARDHVEPAALQREAVAREVVHRRRVVDAAGEPRLHRVPVGRGDVDGMVAAGHAQVGRHEFIVASTRAAGERAAHPADRNGHDQARRHRHPAHILAERRTRHRGARRRRDRAQLALDAGAQQVGRPLRRQVAQEAAHRARLLETAPAVRAPRQGRLERRTLGRRQLAVDIGVDHRLTCRTVHDLSFQGGRAVRPPVSLSPAPGAT